MNPAGFFAPSLVLMSWAVFLAGFGSCQEEPHKPVVKIGAIFTYDSVIGRAAKAAMEAAVSDVNSDPTILKGTELRMVSQDANCSVFMGSIQTFLVIEQKVVAILGPQSSEIAHMTSSIATNLQIPLISFAATDPTLSALQFPFFVRTAQSDSYQMVALAELIDFYEWREIIAVYVDDEYGRNGISVLGDELEKRMISISYRLPLAVQVGSAEITRMLNESKLFGPRVYVVHLNPDPSLRIFKIAQELNMMTTGFAWFATDWLSATIDSIPLMNEATFEMIQGTIALRQYIPESACKKVFLSKWDILRKKGLVSSGMNTYGLCAYDSVWVVARALDRYLRGGGNITFAASNALYNTDKSKIQFTDLQVFTGGDPLLKNLLKVNFTGLTGRVQFNSDREPVNGGYEVINIGKEAVNLLGFWSKLSGFSVSPLSLNASGNQDSYSREDQELGNVTWPGGSTVKPLGWVIADNERPLRIGIPNRFSFRDFVMENDSHKIQGYSIDVFVEACKLVPYEVPYRFVPFGDGTFNPSYDELIKLVYNDVFDAAVGDIAIVTNRTRIVDFSQPYVSTGLVIVAPIDNEKASAWVFLKPFSAEMWCVIAASFVMIAVVIWFLEHRVNNDFRGPPKRQLVTILLFSFSTLFKKNQENTVSPLGRLIMVIWLFLLMVITSSYTASLTSILTIQQLSSPITGIDSLVASEWPIGYQVGSFTRSYLANSLYINPSRLISLGSPEEYARALKLGPKNGGVAAIVDELPYIELFLSDQTEFGIIGETFTKSGWGFAFRRGSPLAVDISTAILKLSESGKLQDINKKWFCRKGCSDERRQSAEANQLQLKSFWGLYLLCGGTALVALLVFILRVAGSYVHYKRQQHLLHPSPSSPEPRVARCSEVVYSFFDFIDQKEEAIKRALSSSISTVIHHENPQSRPPSQQ